MSRFRRILSHRHFHRLVERMNRIVLWLERALSAKQDHWLILRFEVVCSLYYGLEKAKCSLKEIVFRSITSPKVKNIVFIRSDLIRGVRCHVKKMCCTFCATKKMSNEFSNRLNHICCLDSRWYWTTNTKFDDEIRSSFFLWTYIDFVQQE